MSQHTKARFIAKDTDGRKRDAAPEMYEVLRQIRSLNDRHENGEGFSDDEGEDVMNAVVDILAKIHAEV